MPDVGLIHENGQRLMSKKVTCNAASIVKLVSGCVLPDKIPVHKESIAELLPNRLEASSKEATVENLQTAHADDKHAFGCYLYSFFEFG